MKKLIALSIIYTTFQIGGYVFLFTVDWRIGLGAFLLLWGHNIERHR